MYSCYFLLRLCPLSRVSFTRRTTVEKNTLTQTLAGGDTNTWYGTNPSRGLVSSSTATPVTAIQCCKTQTTTKVYKQNYILVCNTQLFKSIHRIESFLILTPTSAANRRAIINQSPSYTYATYISVWTSEDKQLHLASYILIYRLEIMTTKSRWSIAGHICQSVMNRTPSALVLWHYNHATAPTPPRSRNQYYVATYIITCIIKSYYYLAIVVYDHLSCLFSWYIKEHTQ